MRRKWFIFCSFLLLSSFSAAFSNTLFAEEVAVNTSMPVYSYKDAIRETVFVETKVQSSPGGKSDRIAVDIIRPKETEHGLIVPVILDASPYYERLGRGNEKQIKKYDKNGLIRSFPLFYDNYFVPRGYAVVEVDMVGTNHSDGCPTTGGVEEIESTKAVIDWLNGRVKAWDRKGDEIKATWTNGKVGMIGKSYDGALADGVASTGVDGLVTAVSIGAVNNWYDWLRYGGVIRTINTIASMAEVVTNSERVDVCEPIRDRLTKGTDDRTGNYNPFWDERNYVKRAANVKASIFVIHGLNDMNVTMNHASKWWDALAKEGVPRKLWLSQTGHVDPFDFRREKWVNTLHLWFDYWLLGMKNGIMDQPMVDIEHEADQWDTYANWPDQNAKAVDFYMVPGNNGLSGKLGTTLPEGNPQQSYKDSPSQSEDQRVKDETQAKDGRLLFLTPELQKSIRMTGTPHITLHGKVNKEDTDITALIVDYGSDTRVDHESYSEGIVNLPDKDCWGESTASDSPCYYKTKKKLHKAPYEIVTRGWFSAKHWKSFSQIDYLKPGQPYTFQWDFLPQDYIFKKGHRLGVIITGSDSERMVPSETHATVTIDLAQSTIQLPLVGMEELDF